MKNTVSRVFDHFETIAGIPHCSRDAGALRDFLVAFAGELGYEVQTDEAGNILARKGEPTLCLQAHYDMVCVGKAPQIEIIEEQGWLRAVDASLGADNGIAIAMMMTLMEEGREMEYLFTADEEVGLLGAKALDLELRSSYLLNLDTEEEGQVFIGCAGGVDLIASRSCERTADERPLWKVTVSGLPGGHSGVDIDKEIPNAIKVLAHYLADKAPGIVSLRGGERHNSIPVHAEAFVRCEAPLHPEGDVHVERMEEDGSGVFRESERLLELLATAPHGVVERNSELGIPETSLNLAIVDLSETQCRVDYSLRAMSDEGLEALALRTETLLHRYGFRTERREGYPAWKPEVNELTERVASILKSVFGRSETKAIHAGLECGILSEKYPRMKMASIGPTIKNPHSVRERVEIESVKRTFDALERIVENFS